MERASAWLRSATSRRATIPSFVFCSVLIGLTLLEAVPQYQNTHRRSRGGLWQNEPSFLIGDCPWYRTTLISLLNDGDLDLKNNFEPKQYQPEENIALGQNGAWYPKHTILMPITAIPFYLIAHDRGLLAFNLVQLSALALMIWYGALRYTSSTLATALTLWFMFGTMLRAAAYNFAPDVFSSLLVTAAFVALLYRHAPLAGVLLGLAIWSKWTNIVFLPLPGLFLLQRRDLRSFIGYGIAAALPIAGLLLLNQHMFGSPFITPYDHVLIREHGKFVIQPSHRTFFNMPFWDGLWTQLTDKQLGLFEACPPILLAPLGAFLLARRAPAEALLLFGACAAQLATFAKYEQWQAASYGPRFLLSVVTLGALLVAPVLDRLFVGRRSD